MKNDINNFEIDGVKYPLIIKNKNIKNIKIKVDALNYIEVIINSYVDKNKIYEVLNNHIDWLKKRIYFNKRNNLLFEFDELREKKKVLILGKNRKIIYDDYLSDEYILDDVLYTKNKSWTYKEVFFFYRNFLKELYINQVSDLINKPKLIIKPLKSRWGSYNRNKNEITLNLFLLFFDESFIKYVIDHEVSHIKYFDHSKSFYKELEKRCPNYLVLRKQMKNLTPIIRELATY